MIGMILATDMARHVTDLSSFKEILAQRSIKGGENADKIIDHESATKEFDSKQKIIEICLHAADVSTQCRPFEIAHEWTYLLFEEFFNQGDLEKHQNLPVSFLCDRKTTAVAQSQPGFVNFIVAPLFTTLVEVMPSLDYVLEQAKDNASKW